MTSVAAVKVMIELPEPGGAMAVGTKEAVTPEGSPETIRLTTLLNAPHGEVTNVILPDPPGAMVTVAGEEAARVKVPWDANARESTHPVSAPPLPAPSFVYAQRRICAPVVNS